MLSNDKCIKQKYTLEMNLYRLDLIGKICFRCNMSIDDFIDMLIEEHLAYRKIHRMFPYGKSTKK